MSKTNLAQINVSIVISLSIGSIVTAALYFLFSLHGWRDWLLIFAVVMGIAGEANRITESYKRKVRL